MQIASKINISNELTPFYPLDIHVPSLLIIIVILLLIARPFPRVLSRNVTRWIEINFLQFHARRHLICRQPIFLNQPCQSHQFVRIPWLNQV